MLSTEAFEAWTLLINVLIQKYFQDTISICIIWNENIEFQLNASPVPIIGITRESLADDMERDIHDFSDIRQKLKLGELHSDDLEQKLTISIEKSFCEGFMAFQSDIPILARAFRNASKFSIWHSSRSRFIFGHIVELIKKEDEDYFTDYLFTDQPNILVIEAENITSTNFDIKTNKFIGLKADNPEQLYLLNRFDAETACFEMTDDISTEKITDLQGREIVLGAFDYRPFVMTDFEYEPQVQDNNENNLNGSIAVDGAEARYLITFCELHNCTFQFDSSLHDWGISYPNYTADGVLGLLNERKTDMAMAAFYLWYAVYASFDMSAFLGRSGVTCMVPAPKIQTSWSLPIKPFQFTLWLAVGACLILETLGLLVTRRVELTLAQEKNTWMDSLKFGYITTLKLFISQGSDYVVNSTSVRTVLFACYMIDIIITSIYGGGLASILTLPTFGEAADSAERLRKFKLKWAATTFDWVETLKDATDDQFTVDLLENYRVYTFEQMTDMAKTEDMGFVLERMQYGHFGNSEFLTEEALDRLKLMVDDIYYQYTAAFAPRAWPFLAKFDTLVYNWHSSGFDKFWEWKVTADFSDANQQNRIESSMYTNFDTGPVKLGISNFAGLILIWFVGIFASILAFGMEMFYYYRCQRKVVKIV